MRHAALALAALALASENAAAHRVNIFAWTEGGQVITESKFSNGQKVSGGLVTVTDASSGVTLLEGRTTDDGLFSFKATPEMAGGLVLRINAGEGHQNTWTVDPEEAALAAGTAPAGRETAATAAPGTAKPPTRTRTLSEEDIAAIEQAADKVLARRLAPLQRKLALATDPVPKIQDIVGGIGWLVGLAGIAAYFRRRK